MSDVLLIGSATADIETLRNALDSEFVEVPSVRPEMIESGNPESWPWGDVLDTWRSETSDGPLYSKVVVAVWDVDVPAAAPIASLDHTRWFARQEGPFARWFAAMGVAMRRCSDGGAVVAVIERPSPLDCAGRAAEASLGDAIEAMVRSLARSEGTRKVRVNAVTTPTRLAPKRVVEPAPSLARYPGVLEADVLGAVRLMLDDDAIGVTGSVLDADGGRSWR